MQQKLPIAVVQGPPIRAIALQETLRESQAEPAHPATYADLFVPGVEAADMTVDGKPPAVVGE